MRLTVFFLLLLLAAAHGLQSCADGTQCPDGDTCCPTAPAGAYACCPGTNSGTARHTSKYRPCLLTPSSTPFHSLLQQHDVLRRRLPLRGQQRHLRGQQFHRQPL